MDRSTLTEVDLNDLINILGLHRLHTGSSDPKDFVYTDETEYKEIEFRPNGLKKMSVWPEGEPSDKSGYDCTYLRAANMGDTTPDGFDTFGPGPLPDLNRAKDGQWEMARSVMTHHR